MLYNGASVEEVEAAIDKKEQEKREYQEKAKREALEQQKNKEIKTRLETAEALARAGVITKQDLENIKAEADKEITKLNEELDKLNTKTDAENSTNNESSNNENESEDKNQ